MINPQIFLSCLFFDAVGNMECVFFICSFLTRNGKLTTVQIHSLTPYCNIYTGEYKHVPGSLTFLAFYLFQGVGYCNPYRNILYKHVNIIIIIGLHTCTYISCQLNREFKGNTNKLIYLDKLSQKFSLCLFLAVTQVAMCVQLIFSSI